MQSVVMKIVWGKTCTGKAFPIWDLETVVVDDSLYCTWYLLSVVLDDQLPFGDCQTC